MLELKKDVWLDGKICFEAKLDLPEAEEEVPNGLRLSVYANSERTFATKSSIEIKGLDWSDNRMIINAMDNIIDVLQQLRKEVVVIHTVKAKV